MIASQQSEKRTFSVRFRLERTFFISTWGKKMKQYIVTEKELSDMKEIIFRLLELRLLLPGALDFTPESNENSKELLAQLIESIEKPEDMHEAICDELGQLCVILYRSETRSQ